MSSDTPPNPFFSGINFNPTFFNSSPYLTITDANAQYLKLISGKSSYTLNITTPTPTQSTIFQTKFSTFNQGDLLLQPNGGYVGIGTNATTAYKLFVNGFSKFSGGTIFDGTFTLGSTAGTDANIQIGQQNGYNLAKQRTANQYSTAAAINDIVLRSDAKILLQAGGGASAMCINNNNYIQLGNATAIANFPITINSSASVGGTISTYAIASTASYLGGQTAPITPNFMLGVIGTAGFSSTLYIYSDARIKKDIKKIENSLDLIEKINPISYKYIDFVKNGTINNYGVIAQEIEKIIPDIINKATDYIPNIYKNVDKYDNELLRLYIKTDELSIGDKIKIFDIKNKEHLKKVIDKNDDYITIDEAIENYEDGNDIFIYGKEINDLKNVNYEALFSINLKATKELYNLVKEQDKRIRILENLLSIYNRKEHK